MIGREGFSSLDEIASDPAFTRQIFDELDRSHVPSTPQHTRVIDNTSSAASTAPSTPSAAAASGGEEETVILQAPMEADNAQVKF